MKLSDFDFKLPKDLIAQFPTNVRDQSRLLVLGENGELIDTIFNQLTNYLKAGDLLVMNNSRVINAKLELRKSSSAISVNLNKPLGCNLWHGFARPAKKLKINDTFYFDDNIVCIDQKLEDGSLIFKFQLDNCDIYQFLNSYGYLPLPPYIRSGTAQVLDKTRYQTIFSDALGSVAAPTAGLHFTDEVFKSLDQSGIKCCFITLHVGSGTYLPVKTESIAAHKMHSEHVEISAATALEINQTKKEGRRIIAVGTTALRAIESAMLNSPTGVAAGEFDTDIFINSPSQLQITDGLITNFHLPKSTLLILVSAFTGYDNIMLAYTHAINNNYRFFSYGDAMLMFRNNQS